MTEKTTIKNTHRIRTPVKRRQTFDEDAEVVDPKKPVIPTAELDPAQE